LFQISKPGNSEAGTAGAFCVVGLILRDRDKGRTYNMAYDELLAPVLKSIQQHQQEIADKTASFERHRAARRQKLADLKTKIAELKEQIQNLTAGQIH
jgi:phage shock protein A